jgi:hypothetical protein
MSVLATNHLQAGHFGEQHKHASIQMSVLKVLGYRCIDVLLHQR